MPITHDLRWLPVGPVVLVLLSAGAGATDALVFTELGKVFASILTGNLVLLGAAVGLSGIELTPPLTVLVAYLIGVAVAARWCRAIPGMQRTARIRHCLAGEAALVVVVAVFADALGAIRIVLLAVAALAMGVQSAAVLVIDRGSPTTYMTSTFTGLVSDLAANRRVDPLAIARIAAVILGAAAAVALYSISVHWGFVIPAALIASAASLAYTRSWHDDAQPMLDE
ncbi:YoaK family protein [Nocardia pseudovaccinii]|uniref:YoaK family protein n=1 Tax=Nocardia pseudovaccinii TaxID=189540 RepID=UPI0007A3A991|nr:YoaK family protein [Nocardia pseudovaccinii]